MIVKRTPWQCQYIFLFRLTGYCQETSTPAISHKPKQTTLAATDAQDRFIHQIPTTTTTSRTPVGILSTDNTTEENVGSPGSVGGSSPQEGSDSNTGLSSSKPKGFHPSCFTPSGCDSNGLGPKLLGSNFSGGSGYGAGTFGSSSSGRNRTSNITG